MRLGQRLGDGGGAQIKRNEQTRYTDPSYQALCTRGQIPDQQRSRRPAAGPIRCCYTVELPRDAAERGARPRRTSPEPRPALGSEHERYSKQGRGAKKKWIAVFSLSLVWTPRLVMPLRAEVVKLNVRQQLKEKRHPSPESGKA